MTYDEKQDFKELLVNLDKCSVAINEVLEVMVKQMEVFIKEGSKESAEKGMKLNDEFLKLSLTKTIIQTEINLWGKKLNDNRN